jgi:hypothetical protein
MMQISSTFSASPLLSPRTADYVSALIREGDKFDYYRWLQQVRGEEARASSASGRISTARWQLRRTSPWGMARLPHCWLHRRVLADLGRPLDTGISPASLRAAQKSKKGQPTEVDGPALFRLSKPSLTLRACLDAIRTSHHPRSNCRWRNVVRPTR